MNWNRERRHALWVQLAEYRERNATKAGKPLPRATILEAMRDCPDVPGSFFAGVGEKALDNRLWRFEAGKETQEATLDALSAFLSYAHASLLDELVDDDDEEMLATYNLMANASPLAKTVFAAIEEGVYTPGAELNQFGLELHFTRHPDHMLLLVEEHWYEKDARAKPTNPAVPLQRGLSCTVRRGYAFLATEHCLMHIFLNGKHAWDRVHYVQPSGLVSDGRPYLVRLGGAALPSALAPSMEAQAQLQLRQYIPDSRRRGAAGVAVEPRHPPMALSPPAGGMAWGVFPLTNLPQKDVLNRFLIRAVNESAFEPTRFALNGGADPNWQDEEGWNALHHAASVNARTSLRLLVASGKCDYLIPTNKGLYASDLAVLGGRDFGVARLLTRKRLAQAARLGVPCRR
jgi:hypothetical protein